ncbi:hypothetical protein BGZ76_001090 [Entomortierella beljakovae]|nr:hypothetical protein BGZ76_001090 [Entomortierella beljakovae]
MLDRPFSDQPSFYGTLQEEEEQEQEQEENEGNEAKDEKDEMVATGDKQQVDVSTQWNLSNKATRANCPLSKSHQRLRSKQKPSSSTSLKYSRKKRGPLDTKSVVVTDESNDHGNNDFMDDAETTATPVETNIPGYHGPRHYKYPDALMDGIFNEHPRTINIRTTLAHSGPHKREQQDFLTVDEERSFPHTSTAIPPVMEDRKLYSTVRALAKAARMVPVERREEGEGGGEREEEEGEEGDGEGGFEFYNSDVSTTDLSIISSWTKDDHAFAKALWDYWDELDALNRIHDRLESELDELFDHPPQCPAGLHGQDYRHHQRLKLEGLLPKDYPRREPEWYQEDISGPIVRFPLSAPMPTMHHQWIALVPCDLESVTDLSIFQLDASAIIFYPTVRSDCTSLPTLNGSTLPLVTLTQKDSDNLISTLDSLSYGTLAMCTISRIIPHGYTSNEDDHPVDKEMDLYQKQDDNPKVDQVDTDIDTKENEQHDLSKKQTIMSILDIVSMVDSFTTDAALKVRRVLVNLGLDARYNAIRDEKRMVARKSPKSNDRTSGSSPPHQQALRQKERGDAIIMTNGEQEKQSTVFAGEELSDSNMVTIGEEEMEEIMETPVTSSIFRPHPKARTRPNRLSQRHPNSMSSQLFDEVQYLIMEKAANRHSNGLSTFWSNSYIQTQYTKYVDRGSNASVTGKVTMLLMSTVCGVGMGMFGALLFVVALKVRLFQSRRSSHGTNSQNIVAQHLVTLQQREVKKVIPKIVLESFSIQSVVHNNSTIVTLSAAKPKAKSNMNLYTKGKLGYVKDVIEMEEGLEDSDARENSRRQRMMRRRRTGSGQILMRMIHDDCSCEDGEGDDEKESADGESESESDMDEGSTEGSMTSTDQTGTASRGNSYRRITYNRQGQLNPLSAVSTLSSSENLDTASSTSLSVSISSNSQTRSETPTRNCCLTHSHRKKKKRDQVPFANANAQTLCAICLAEYEVGEKVRTLPCFHQFHQGCIDPWLLNVSSLCPICKRDLWPGGPGPTIS